MAALFGAPSVPQAPDPFAVLNNASSTLIRFNDWAQTIGRTDTKDIGALETRIGTGKSAIVSARRGLQALSELKIQRCISSADIEAHEDRLVSSLGQAAAMTYVACEQLIDQKLAQELGATLTDSSGLAQFDAQAIRLVQPEPWHALRAHLLDVIAALEEVFRRIKSPMTNRAPSDSQKDHLPLVRMTMGSCYTRMQAVRGVLCDIYARRLSDQASNCGLPQVMDRLNALEEIDRSMDAKVRQALNELTEIHVERYFSTEHSLTPEMLAMYKNVLVEYAELRGR
ncbi:outer protein P, partial [Xanthomonas vasicola pv. musacearum NCPPB 4392]